MPERTADGHHVVIEGRKWRATDPAIPQRFESELVAELMAARRLVKTHGDEARPRVHDAKVALGERGEPWWEDASDSGRAERMAATIRSLLCHRDPQSTICPSDVARVVGGADWRQLVAPARAVAVRLSEEGLVRITQHGADVDPATVRGPVRIARGPSWPADR